MNEIKPAEERLKLWCEQNQLFVDSLYGLQAKQGFIDEERKELREAYKALQKENADLQKENCDQKRKIIGLENELVEWNEFKKIRDAQMQALRKQMT